MLHLVETSADTDTALETSILLFTLQRHLSHLALFRSNVGYMPIAVQLRAHALTVKSAALLDDPLTVLIAVHSEGGRLKQRLDGDTVLVLALLQHIGFVMTHS